MADALQIETSTDRYLLEDGSGIYLLESTADVAAQFVMMRPVIVLMAGRAPGVVND